jgi:hypothetical protein
MNRLTEIVAVVMFALAATLGVQTVAAQTVFQHPGVLLSKAQLDFVKAQVNAHVNPFYQEFLNAQASIYGQTTAYTPLGPYPGGLNQCGSSSTPDNGCSAADQDSTTAYVQALLWYITGNKIYATNAINIMNTYAQNFKGWAGFTTGYPCPGVAATCSNGPVQAGWDSTKWPRAAEIIRYSNAGWAATDIQAFSTMLTNIYEPQIYNGSGDNGNWELAMIEGMMGIAVFNEDSALLAHAQLYWSQRVPAYFYYDPIDQGTPQPFPRNTGSTTWNGQVIFNASVSGICQETCRDLKHTSYGIASAINAAETDYLQGGTLYASQEPRLITGLEFNANLEDQGLSITGTSLPVASDMCTNDTNGKERMTVTLGEGYTWVIAYNHFHNRLGQSMPWSVQWIAHGVLPNTLPVDVGGHMIVFEPLTHYADFTSSTVPNFSLAISPDLQTILPGASATYPVTLTPLNGYTGTDTLSITNLPTGATASFSQGAISGGSGTSTLTITTSSAIQPANYVMAVTASDGTISNSESAGLDITGPTTTITANDQAMAYGGTVPTVTYTQSPSGALHTKPACVTSITSTTAPGVYPGAITCSGATRTGYSFIYVAGQMTVTSLGTVIITANNQTVAVGGALPALTYSVSPNLTLDTAPTCTSADDGTGAAGVYPGAITCSGASLGGYTINYVAGQMTVTSLGTVTITANSQGMTYGGSLPTLTYTVSPSITLSTAPTCTSTANGSSAVGAYPGAITCAGATTMGYTFTYVTGKMTITAATAAITANNQTTVAGGSVPVLTYAVSPSVTLTTAPTCTTTGTSSSPTGSYPINCAGAVLANYTFAYTAGTLTITAAPNPVPAIISLSPPNLKTSSAAFSLTLTGSGFINGSVVSWGGSNRSTTYVDASHLTASIITADLASVGTAAVIVANPVPGGGVSPVFLFAIDTASTAPGYFSVSATSPTLNITQGQNATVPLTVTGLSSSALLTATCLNLPAGANCSFDSNSRSVTIATTSATPKQQYEITVVCAATQQITAMVRGSSMIWLGFAVVPFALIGCRRGKSRLFALLLSCTIVLTLAGCGSGGSVPGPGSVSTSTQTSLSFTLNVN